MIALLLHNQKSGKMARCCTKKTKTAAFIIFVSACAGFSMVLIIVASAQLSNAMPLVGTAAFGMSIMCLVCCYDPEELEAYAQGQGASGLDMDQDEAFRQAAKDHGAVFAGILVSVGMGINVLLWRYSLGYTTFILVLTVIGNTLLLSAIISIVWIFCFAPRIWSAGGGGDDEGGVGTIDW